MPSIADRSVGGWLGEAGGRRRGQHAACRVGDRHHLGGSGRKAAITARMGIANGQHLFSLMAGGAPLQWRDLLRCSQRRATGVARPQRRHRHTFQVPDLPPRLVQQLHVEITMPAIDPPCTCPYTVRAATEAAVRALHLDAGAALQLAGRLDVDGSALRVERQLHLDIRQRQWMAKRGSARRCAWPPMMPASCATASTSPLAAFLSLISFRSPPA